MSKFDPSTFNDDDLLDAIRGEQKLTSSNRDKRDVRLERDGELWSIRFLPVKYGERKLFFSRVAQHWINRKPHFCERMTPAESGGNPDAKCLLCDLAEELEQDRGSRDISSLGYKSKANPQWLMFCLVWSKKSPGQELWEPEGDEVWMPYKFWLNKAMFDEVSEYYLRYRGRNIVDSILNPEKGNDFYVKKTNNRLVLQKDDPKSIFPNDYTEDEKAQLMEFILGQVKWPNYHPLTQEEMDAAVLKLEDAASKLRVASSSSRRGRSRDGGEEEEQTPTRSSRSSGPPPRARSRSDAPPSRADRDEDQSEVPDRPSSRSQVPSCRSVSEDADQPSQARSGPPRSQSVPPSAQRSAPPRSVPPSATRSAPPRSAPPSRASSRDDSGMEDDLPFDKPRTDDPPKPSARLRQAASNPQPPEDDEPAAVPERRTNVQSSVDDDDDVTQEVTDRIPADSSMADAPPTPVAAVQPPTQRSSKMSDRLRAAIRSTDS